MKKPGKGRDRMNPDVDSGISLVSGWERMNSMLLRFDCDLSQDIHDPQMKKHRVNYRLETYFNQRLTREQRERIAAANGKLSDH